MRQDLIYMEAYTLQLCILTPRASVYVEKFHTN